jgi:hypothetical protein
MDETQELSLADSIAILLEGVPAPIRAFVLNDLQSTSQELMVRHQLHVDQGGVLEKELLLLLLGQENPEEFSGALRETGIPNEVVQGIVRDVNQQVFMRLREEERAQANVPVSTPRPIKQPLVPAPTLVEKPEPVDTLPPMPSDAFLEPHHTPVPAPYTQKKAVPDYVINALEAPTAPKRPEPPANLPGQEPLPPQPAPVAAAKMPDPVPPTSRVPEATFVHHHPTRTMAADMEALKAGTDPFRVAHPEPPAWASLEVPKAPTPSRVDPVVPTNTSTSQPIAPAPRAPSTPAPVKEYSVDPYREPIS